MKKIVILPNYDTETHQELLNHKVKCRLCFQRISGTRNISRITDSVQQKFFSLTNIELTLSDKLSNSICEPCFKSLNEASEFQTKMIDNQRRLYAFEGEADAPVVKAEPIESNTIELQEINIVDVFLPKTEVFDDTWVGDFQTPDSDEVSRPAAQLLVKSEIEFLTKEEELLVKRQKKKERVSDFRERRSDIVTELNTELDYSCDLCGFSVKGKGSLSRHMSRHAPTKTKSYIKNYTKRDLDEALKAVEAGRFTVRGAEKHYKVPRSTIADRVRKAQTDGSKEPEFFKCSFCDKIYSSKTSRRLHEIMDHLAPVGEFPCKVCGKVFTTEIRLKSHHYYVHICENRLHKCKECGEVFDNHSRYRAHISTHREKVACHFCGKLEHKGFQITKHMRQHKNLGTFKCTFEGCPKTYPRKSGLKKHFENTHAPNQNVKCSKCDKAFQNEFKLRFHMERSHTEPRFFCAVDGCAYKSTRREYLKLHLRNHRDIDEKLRDELIMNLPGSGKSRR